MLQNQIKEEKEEENEKENIEKELETNLNSIEEKNKKIKKIQSHIKGFLYRKKYNSKIKPNLKKEEKFIKENLLKINEEEKKDELKNFKSSNWKKYYKESKEESFFNNIDNLNENKTEEIIIDNKNKSLYKGNINNDENKIEGFEI
jgi:hypothetical protein